MATVLSSAIEVGVWRRVTLFGSLVAILLVCAPRSGPAEALRSQRDLGRAAEWHRVEQMVGVARKYAEFVAKQEDPLYGYKREYGYPMYLYYLSGMHRSLYATTGESRYFARYLRGAEYALNQARGYTWEQYVGDDLAPREPNPLYNALFVELFLDAYDDTRDPKYRAAADGTAAAISGLLATQDLATAPQDYQVLMATTISAYLGRTGQRDLDLLALADQLWSRAWSTYDAGSGRWYYDAYERAVGKFDGRSAYYELTSALFFMRRSEEVKATLPGRYSEFRNRLPAVMRAVERFVLPSGGFFYASAYPDYTESTGQVIWAFEIYDRAFDDDHDDVKERAKVTISQGQDVDGGFYETPGSSGKGLMYSDNLGWGLAGWARGGYPSLGPGPGRALIPAVRK
ncbi:MAG: hypothetical protein HY329_00500 [Chloroflexi bacterium]|nr:hypothetical protein [Chloroflexota bacterium]